MRDVSRKLAGLLLGVATLFAPFVASAVYIVPQGGTGSTTLSGILRGNGTNAVKTLLIGTGLLFDGSTLSASGGSNHGSISTSSPGIVGRLLYFTTAGATPELVAPVATSSLTAAGLLSLSNPISVIGNSASVLSLTGGSNGQILAWLSGIPAWVASTTFSSPLLYSAGNVTCQTASGSLAGCLSAADWTTFNGKGSGTVTSIATNNGLTGGTITTTGTLGLAAINANSVLGNINGASGVPGSIATTSLYTGTAGQILAFLNGGWIGTATTTFSAPLLYASGNVTCRTADTSNSGCISSTDWNTFNNKGSGTVTAVSVATANGFAGSSGGGATPILTLTTSITGLLKGNGTAISAAALTDFPTQAANTVLVNQLGSIAAPTAQATTTFGTNLFGVGTNGKVLAEVLGVPTWTATTTFSTGLTYASGGVTCDTATASVFGCLTAANFTTFNAKQAPGFQIATTTVPTFAVGNLAYLTGTTPTSIAGIATTSATINNGLTGTLTTIGGTQTIGLATINAGVLGAVVNGAVPTSQATSSLYGIGTGGQLLGWANGGLNFIASTTYASPLAFANNQVTCTTCLTANQSITLSGAVTGTGATAITTAFGTLGQGVLGNPFAAATIPTALATSSLYGAASTGGFVLGWSNTLNGLTLMATSSAGGAGSPGGADTNVQYNDGSAFGGTTGFNFTKANSQLTIPNNGWYGIGGNLFGYGSTTNQSTVLGLGAGGQNSTTSLTVANITAVGWQAGSAITSGLANTAIGSLAMSNITGSTSPQNTAVGYGALWGNTTSVTATQTGQNTAVGTFALASTTTGNRNTALGFNAGRNIASASTITAIGYLAIGGATAGTSGSSNTAIGSSALSLVTGNSNIAVGSGAGSGVQAGSRNTYIGVSSGQAAGTGQNNTTLGFNTGFDLSTGYDNIIIGSTQNSGGSSITSGGGNILIGYNPVGSSNSARSFLNIGNSIFGTLAATSSATSLSQAFTGVNLGIATTSPGGRFAIAGDAGGSAAITMISTSTSAFATTTVLAINSAGDLLLSSGMKTSTAGNALCYTTSGSFFTVVAAGNTTCVTSSQRFKHNIKSLTLGLDTVMKMLPRSFDRNPPLAPSMPSGHEVGLIAEEVQKIAPVLVEYEADGKTPRGVNYQEYTAVLTKAIQEQQKEIENLQKGVIVMARSVEENWQWGAIALLFLWNMALTFKRKKI